MVRGLTAEAKLTQFRISKPKESGRILFGIEDFSGHYDYCRGLTWSFKTPEHSAASLSCTLFPRPSEFVKPTITLVESHGL